MCARRLVSFPGMFELPGRPANSMPPGRNWPTRKVSARLTASPPPNGGIRNFARTATAHCEWDGAVWPFATSQTLGALANVLRDYKSIRRFIARLF